MKIYAKLILIAFIAMPIHAMDPKTPLHKIAGNCEKFVSFSLPPRLRNGQLDKTAVEQAITARNGEGNIPLHEAAAFNCARNVYSLIEAKLELLWGSPYTLGLKKNETLAQLKSRIQALPLDNDDYNSYINAKDVNGLTPLDKARSFGHPGMEQILIEYGGKYNIYPDLNKDLTQQELDYILFKPGSSLDSTLAVINALKRGANPNVRDKEGKTVLHHILGGDPDYQTPFALYEVLLAYGADINALDNKNKTPADYHITASETGATFYPIFQKHGALTGEEVLQKQKPTSKPHVAKKPAPPKPRVHIIRGRRLFPR